MARKKQIEHTYWEEHGKHGFYQMGDNPVRSYIVETAVKKNVKKFLDIGCGSGPIYEIIKNNDIKIDYTGTDYSSSFVKLCKKEFPKARWVVDDMRRLQEFKSGEFDMLLYLHSLDHVGSRWCDALDEAYRVSSKYVMIVLWRPFSENKINISSHPQYTDSHLCDFHQGSIESYIDNIGFKTLVSKKMMNGGQYNYIYLLKKP